MNTTEEWKDIRGFDGDYQISNLGRVRSTKRNRITILSPAHIKTATNDDGEYNQHNSYLNIPLRPGRKRGNAKHFMVHRLVAEYFLPQPRPDQVFVNHKDGNRWNNCFSNLEWCNRAENEMHKIHTLGHASGSCIPPKTVKRIEDGVIFPSISLGAKSVGGCQSGLSLALQRENKYYKGFHWSFI